MLQGKVKRAVKASVVLGLSAGLSWLAGEAAAVVGLGVNGSQLMTAGLSLGVLGATICLFAPDVTPEAKPSVARSETCQGGDLKGLDDLDLSGASMSLGPENRARHGIMSDDD